MDIDKLFSFKGTATRSEYWAVILVSYVVMMGLFFLGATIATVVKSLGITIILVAAVASIWVQFAVLFRRWRDANINPWWTVAIALPYIGYITLVVAGCLPTAKSD